MKKYIYLKTAHIFFILLLLQKFIMAGEPNNHPTDILYPADTIKGRAVKSESKKIAKTDSTQIKKISSKTILNILNGVDTTNRIVSWRLDSKSFNLEVVEGVDTSLFFPHLFIPTQKRLETITSLGNMGAPLQTDHFFNRNRNTPFLFSRYYSDYESGVSEHKQYHVKKPLTVLNYTMGGGSSEAEQTLRVLHTQNINKYFNAGITYDYFGTKGMYKDQMTKDNFFSLFGSYYKNRFSFQGTFSYSRIRNQENGGLVDDYDIQDTTYNETTLIPFKLKGASSEVKQKSFSGIVGYNIINRWVKGRDSKGNQVLIKKTVFSVKAMFDANKNSRTYSDIDTSVYKNFYINKGITHDSVMLLTYESTILGEIDQLAKFPG